MKNWGMAKNKTNIIVSRKIKEIHPVMDNIINNLAEIDWDGVIVMDWSDGFWDKMKKKPKNLVML